MGTKPANGYVPANVLIEVQPGIFLENATAKAFLRAKAENPGLTIAPPGGGYRSYQNQYDLKNGIPSYAYWNLDPKNTTGLASPGTSSHGWGICVDVAGQRTWAINNLARFGFSRPFGNSDPGHFLYGAPTWDPVAVVLQPTQRLVLATLPVRRRIGAPSTTAPEGVALPASTVGNFTGWIRGENVNGNDVWFIGTSGDFFWSGGFTDTGTHDLADHNPVTPAPPTTRPTRTIRADVPSANVRDLPTTSTGIVVAALTANTVAEVLGYYDDGKTVTASGVTSSVWFKTAQGWVWSGSFTTQDITGLEKIIVNVPTSGLDPAAPWKTYAPDVEGARWVGSPNYNKYPPEDDKHIDHITAHWMSGYLAGTDATFQNPGTVVNGRGTNAATNFGVGQTEVHQYVRLQDYHHGDGDKISNMTGASVEHEGGPSIPITDAVYENSAQLMAKIMKHALWRGGDKLEVGVNFFPHDHWTTTSCPGTLDLPRLARRVNEILGFEPDPEPEPEPTPDYEAQLAAIQATADANLAATKAFAAASLEGAKVLAQGLGIIP